VSDFHLDGLRVFVSPKKDEQFGMTPDGGDFDVAQFADGDAIKAEGGAQATGRRAGNGWIRFAILSEPVFRWGMNSSGSLLQQCERQ